MKQLKFFLGSFELLVLFLSSGDFRRKSSGFSISSINLSLGSSIFRVAESLELCLFFLVLLFLESCLLGSDTVLLSLSGGFLFS